MCKSIFTMGETLQKQMAQQEILDSVSQTVLGETQKGKENSFFTFCILSGTRKF